MSTLRTSNLIHGSSSINNIVLDTQGRAIFGPNSAQGRASLYVNPQNNRVGINNESPAVALDVDGAINATGNVSFTGDLDIDNGTLFVDSSANYVGIGITTPQRPLHVFSADIDTLALFYSGDADSQINFQDSNSTINGASVGCSGDDFYIRTGLSSNRLTVKSDGNVGIGTTNPDVQLTLNNVTTNTLVSFQQSGTTHAYIGTSSVTNGVIVGSAVGDLNIRSENNNINLSAGGSTSIAMQLDSSGNVGIGTTNPLSELHVERATQAHIIVKTASSNMAKFGSKGNDVYIAGTAGATNVIFKRNVTSTDHPADSGTETARIDASGRLLVGVTSTSNNIGVVVVQGYTGQTAGEGTIDLVRGNNVTAASQGLGSINFGHDQYQGASIDAVSAGAWTENSSHPSNLSFLTTPSGSTTPTQALYLSQDKKVYFSAPWYSNSTTANAANVHAISNGELYRSTSSIKYKSDVETLQDSYADQILNIRPVWYRSLCDGDNSAHGWWGFIAEEVAEIDPRLVQWKTIEVTYDEKGSAVETPCEPEPEGVTYDRFVPHLLNLIKRQQTAIETLEQRLSDAGL